MCICSKLDEILYPHDIQYMYYYDKTRKLAETVEGEFGIAADNICFLENYRPHDKMSSVQNILGECIKLRNLFAR